ncbi:MAG TPA: TIGR01906 family membrane protein [Clostridiaceae bacterium]
MKRLTAAVIAIAVIILSVKFTLNFKPLYYYDISSLNIAANTYLSEDEIKSSYDYLIYYINSNKDIEFNIPLLPSSLEGAIHFREVKEIFKELDYLLYACGAIALFGLYSCIKKREFSFLKLSSNLILAISAAVILPFIINFDASFVIFHKLFFRNNYWLFDPATDPVINILPEVFFFHCLIMIIACIVVSSSLLRLAYKKLNR